MTAPSASHTSWQCRVRSLSKLLSLAIGTLLATAAVASQAAKPPAAGPPAQTPRIRYAVVASRDVPFAELTLDELRRVFLFKRHFWNPGKPVRLILPATGQPARRFLLDQVCQRTEGELRRMILESMYRGESDQAPKVAASEAETLAALESSSGSIALVSDTVALPTGVKRLKIDGKLPEDSDYPLGS
jgi:hypothetical protein